MLLPEDCRVSEDRLARSGQWLYAHLKDKDSNFVRDNFCPCTHGAIVLQMVRCPASEVVVGRSHMAVPTAHNGETLR